MDYQEALASLERGQKQAGMTVKFVPGKTTGGWLSDETRVNLAPVFNASPAQADEKPSIQDMRDRMMGAPGSKKNIAKHPLQIENLVIGGVATRRYRLAALAGQTLPTVLYFHGGAYYGGSVAGAEMLCRALADFAGCQVISVDYPLAPRVPLPSGPPGLLPGIKLLARARRLVPNDARWFRAGRRLGWWGTGADDRLLRPGGFCH